MMSAIFVLAALVVLALGMVIGRHAFTKEVEVIKNVVHYQDRTMYPTPKLVPSTKGTPGSADLYVDYTMKDFENHSLTPYRFTLAELNRSQKRYVTQTTKKRQNRKSEG